MLLNLRILRDPALSALTVTRPCSAVSSLSNSLCKNAELTLLSRVNREGEHLPFLNLVLVGGCGFMRGSRDL